MLRCLAFFLAALLSFPAFAEVKVKDVRLGLQEGGGTRFVMETDGAVDYHLFLLNNPPRAVIDLPALAWNDKLTPVSKGLVKGWRHGQFGQGTRVVLDLSGGASVASVQLLPPGQDGKGARLALDLMPAKEAAFAALIGKTWGDRAKATTQASVVPPSLPDIAVRVGGFPVPPPLPEQRRPPHPLPMIVIDAGHGGVDPGALGANGRREKDLTLAVSKQLAQALKDSKLYRVSLTRSRDVFIPLRERVAIARRKGADLFISLHADSIESGEVKGATIYTLSERATDQETASLAESENRADLLAGLEQVGNDDGSAAILTDMSFRASVNHGHDFSALLAEEMGRVMRLTERPQRSAGFAVLKSPDVPSVLIEMGYISSPSESKLLFQKEHQKTLVQAVLRATQRFFEGHDPTFEARQAGL